VGVRFGTDGIRGVANAEVAAELVLALGRATARTLPSPAFLVGRDTRRSGPLLQAAFSAGLASEGVDVVDLGILPTPGVAWLGAERGLPGAVISASHNPFTDNGVKLFAPGGLKLPDAVEREVEQQFALVTSDAGGGPHPPTGHGVGRLWSEPDAALGYIEHLVGLIEDRTLDGMRVVIDCAHGAASTFAPVVLERLGAQVEAIACEPNGSNINSACGSTHPERVAAAVLEHHADIGLALDGDADRLVAVDNTGTPATGDELLALFAADLARRGRLAGNTVVMTVMSNLGFRLAMDELGITVRETPVGDRYVLEALAAGGFSLGGEQSGHLVFRELATTGDGILTGVLLVDLLRRAGRSLSELRGEAMQRMPQVLVNVAALDPSSVVADAYVQTEVAAVSGELAGRGRVLLRASGTEPLVRVMVEAQDEVVAHRAADRLRAVVARVASPAGAVE
jgi:phosphoglucosamine mutase